MAGALAGLAVDVITKRRSTSPNGMERKRKLVLVPMIFWGGEMSEISFTQLVLEM